MTVLEGNVDSTITDMPSKLQLDLAYVTRNPEGAVILALGLITAPIYIKTN